MAFGMKRVMMAAVLSVLGTAAAHAADEYTIKIDRDIVSGDTFDIAMTDATKRVISVIKEGKSEVAEDETVKVELKGRIKVQSADTRGVPAEFDLTVDTLTLNGEAVAEPKSAFHVKRNEKGAEVTSPDGKAASGKVDKALDALFPRLTPGSVSDDERYPAKGPKKVGDSWDLDAEKTAKDAAGAGITMQPKNLKGKATLKDAKKSAAGTDLVLVLTVETTIDALDMFTAMGLVMQPESKMSADVTITQSADVKDKSRKHVSNKAMHMQLKAKGKDDEVLDVKMTGTSELSITPAK